MREVSVWWRGCLFSCSAVDLELCRSGVWWERITWVLAELRQLWKQLACGSLKAQEQTLWVV